MNTTFTFKEYFKETIAQEESRGKLIGGRVAKSLMASAYNMAFQIIRKCGACEIKAFSMPETPENIGLSFATPQGEDATFLYASSSPELKEWLDAGPSLWEMAEFRKAFTNTFAKAFEIQLEENVPAVLDYTK